MPQGGWTETVSGEYLTLPKLREMVIEIDISLDSIICTE